MNPAYDTILSADTETRAGLFAATAQRIGTTPQNVEKDFWVCWTLDALFNGMPDGPRLLFKGGTSLSKGFGLIRRFSEDIDVTVFRDDLGEGHSVEDLQTMSGKKREKALDAIREACEAFINGAVLENLARIAADASERNGIAVGQLKIVPDKDRQTLLVRYPTATEDDAYIPKAVKIESGAKSALDPNSVRSIRPYLEEDAPGLDLEVPNITIVDAERTFWDKVVILHGLRHWYETKGVLRGGGNRISRHYYDLHELMQSPVGKQALADPALGADCVAHARMFFNRPAFDLASAVPPTFTLMPEGAMYDALKLDYAAMSRMIFGTAPSFEAVSESIAELESRVNALESS
ncbi:nucleotidyl transferase AbiEii/AbiGii toxin family protein [Sphingomonas canadensis]|uniref:Nucleotidyl transferase AbiEii/AbiGii toxin family protein n=1 Tax=Sphingomonas canadensis TaxID=1219257 RepID=A0ABW3HDK4_9SPHN|nr:nucleotidyl transferase AbiEii/AbiGii toxin family protein [Sphingomonas canadensis]MCW3838153.1 nucleotidyl transferase AbiEii/AbiGii toxin family protein [Sphingomonas canadensis]